MFYSETKPMKCLPIRLHQNSYENVLFETLLLEKGEMKKHHFFLIIASFMLSLCMDL